MPTPDSSRALPPLALVVGLAIASVDMRPSWDDTGITAAALSLAAGLGAFLGLRWWVATCLIAGPILLAEAPSAGSGILVALLFALAGSLLGAGLRRGSGAAR